MCRYKKADVAIMKVQRKEKKKMPEKLKVELNVALSNKDIDDIMDTAMYGIEYWCSKVTPEESHIGKYTNEQISCGGILKLQDTEGGRYFCLTKEKLIQGLKKYLEKHIAGDFLEFVDHELRIDVGNIDANVADAIIQYALFGDIIYG